MRVNENIRARQIRLINTDGKQLGITTVKEGLSLAEEKGLDLVEIAPHAKPPVCRIMDLGKHKYEQSKKEREARKKQKTISVKEVKLRLNIEEHDFQVKVRNMLRFLNEGNKVKITVMFRGREISHPEQGVKICDRIIEEIKEVGVVEKKPKVEGRNMIMIVSPKNEK